MIFAINLDKFKKEGVSFVLNDMSIAIIEFIRCNLKEEYEYVYMSSYKKRDMAERLNKSLNSINNELKKMVDAGILVRSEEDKREYKFNSEMAKPVRHF